MLIGIDLDNTIVCYDHVFHRVAVERGLIPPSTPDNKSEVRDYLRRIGNEDAWTALQGAVYGPEMAQARLFPGVLDFLACCRERGVSVSIISHRTRYPFLGPPYDLHESAWRWLEAEGVLETARTGLSPDRVFLEQTKQTKLARIRAEGCDCFIDDLPEFLLEPEFPMSVQRVLFDPNRLYDDAAPCIRVTSWNEAGGVVSGLERTLPGEADNVLARAGRLIREAGIKGEFRLARMTGGANNRLYRVETEGAPRAVLKAYFHHPDDPRDRLRAEFSFSTFAWNNGVRALPQALACDREGHIGLYEFLRGRRIRPDEVAERHVAAALEFVEAVNRRKDGPEASQLPVASEACYSLLEHLRLVEGRIERLSTIEANTQVRGDAVRFVQSELGLAWRGVQRRVRDLAESESALASELAPTDRVISPSDFGFHNALVCEDGTLRFFDFEYAGWDDPAKLVCDFFCQPAVPVPLKYYGSFAGRIAALAADPALQRRRMDALLPVYRLKWCCILLNEFLPVSAARRRFARGEEGEAALARQLQEARQRLQSLWETPANG